MIGSLIRDTPVRRVLPYEVIAFENRNDRMGAIHRAWGHVFTNHIEGAYYEFGVYRGETFRASHRAYRELFAWAQKQLISDEPWRRKVIKSYADYTHEFYAFDTFSGMPENAEGNAMFSARNFECSLEDFSRFNRNVGILEGKGVRYFKGTFAEIARREGHTLAALQPAAIVNIDCDLYASTRDALELVHPKLAQGSVVLVDDWNVFNADRNCGERWAVREFLATHPEFSFEPWLPYAFVGQAFLVHSNVASRNFSVAVVDERASLRGG